MRALTIALFNTLILLVHSAVIREKRDLLSDAANAVSGAYQSVVDSATSQGSKAFAGTATGSFAPQWKTAGNNHPIILLHGIHISCKYMVFNHLICNHCIGLMGFGEQPMVGGMLNYWGGMARPYFTLLRQNGYTVHVPHMGPVSSNW
jgi:hypothetical protein